MAKLANARPSRQSPPYKPAITGMPGDGFRLKRPMLAYVHIFKTAGTTFTGILRRNFSIRHFDTRVVQEKPAITAAQLKRVLTFHPGIKSLAGHAVRTHADLKTGFPQIRFYTFMRDPRKRVPSSFLFGHTHAIRREGWRPETDKDVEAAFLAFLMRSQDNCCAILAPRGGGAEAAIEAIETEMDFVGLVEHFDESLALFRNWIGRPDFDVRYRRLNVSDERAEKDRALGAVRHYVERLVGVTTALKTRQDIAELIEERQAGDIALFDHIRTNTFERMRRAYGAGPGPFDFEDNTMAVDTVSGRLYRNLVDRPLVPLLARRASA